MNLWERIMLLFFPRHHPRADTSAEVSAAFERMQCARAQVAEASHEVRVSAEAHVARVEQERHRIRARTAETAAKWPSGRTSGVRAAVEGVLRRVDGRDDDQGASE